MVDSGRKVIIPPEEVLEVQHQDGCRREVRIRKMGERKYQLDRDAENSGSIQIFYFTSLSKGTNTTM